MTFPFQANLKPVLVLLLVAILGGASLAQPPGGGRGGRGGRRGPDLGRGIWEAMRTAQRLAPDKELLDMLRHDAIVKELELSAEDKKELSKLGGKVFEQLEEMPRDLDAKQTQEEVLKVLNQYGKEGFEFLEEKIGQTGIKRLEGLYAQSRKFAAPTNGRIAKLIGLEGEELENFRRLAARLQDEMRENARPEIIKIMENSAMSFDKRRVKIESVMERNLKRINERLRRELTPEQRKELEDLQGPKFDNFPRWRRPGPPGGGHGGGRKQSDRGPGSGPDGESPKPPQSGDKSCQQCSGDLCNHK